MHTQTNFGAKVQNMISNEDFREHRARQGFAGLQHVGQTKRAMGFKKSESPSDM